MMTEAGQVGPDCNIFRHASYYKVTWVTMKIKAEYFVVNVVM